MNPPIFIDVFISPLRDSTIAQVAVTAVFLLILLDVLFGVLNACLKKEFDSSVMRAGIGHKCAEIGMLIVGIIADACFTSGFDIGYNAPVFTGIAALICIFEIGSLMETFTKLNPELAKTPVFAILKASQKLLEKENEESED